MKNTQRKNSKRNISKQIVSYISIIVIAMLAVAAFLGINYAADALDSNAVNYWKSLNFRDFDIASTMLMTEDDIAEIKKADGVADAEGVYQTTAWFFGEEEKFSVDVLSMTERISLPEMLEGRLPKNYLECAVEQEIMERMGLKIGDPIKIGDVDGGYAPLLRHRIFFITGTFLHADHYAGETGSGGNRYILVTDDAFDAGALDGCFVKAVVKLDVPEDMSLIGDDYDELSDEAAERLTELAEKRTKLRDSQIKEKAQREIEEGEKKLSEARKELDDGRRELDENAQKIADGEKELDAARKTLDAAKKELDAAIKKLNAAKAKLDENKPKLDEAKAQLDDAAAQLTDGWNEIQSAKSEALSSLNGKIPAGMTVSWASSSSPNVDSASFKATAVVRITIATGYSIDIDLGAIPGNVSSMVHGLLDGKNHPGSEEPFTNEEIESYISQINSALSGTPLGTLLNALDEWNQGHDEYISGRNEYLDAKKKYDDGLAKYKAGLKEYQSGYAKYDRGLYQYNQGIKELEDAKAQLARGEERYAEGSAEYEAGLEKLQEAKDTAAGLHPCRWVILNDSCNPSYVHAECSAQNVRKLAMTFALLFVFIGVLVIYVTIARIIDEQRNLLGTEKALGFFNSEASVKYLMFGISATIIGTILGIGLGYFLLQSVTLMAHGGYYVTETIPRAVNIPYTVTAIGTAVLLSAVAVWFACASLVKTPTVQLMKERIPEYKGNPSGDKDGKSLYSKLIFRNMRNDIRRIIVTVISIAGCCTLIIIGFSVRSSILRAIDRQYSDINKYDVAVMFDPELSPSPEEEIRNVLDRNDLEYTGVYSKFHTFSAGRETYIGQLYCGAPEDIADNLGIYDVRTKESVPLQDHGIYICRRTSEYYKLGVGDTITLYDDNMEPYELPIAGIYEYYIGVSFVMTPQAYRETFGTEMPVNCFLISDCDDMSPFYDDLLKITGVLDITSDVDSYRQSVEAGAAMSMITLMLIAGAGLMAYFILLNLANMYINQKKRELTIMRINGFSTFDVIMYVAREAIVTTILGIIAGIAAGSVFSYFIIKFIQHRNGGFVLTPDFDAWWMSACITVLYSVVIYAIALRKVRYLKLTDIK